MLIVSIQLEYSWAVQTEVTTWCWPDPQALDFPPLPLCHCQQVVYLPFQNKLFSKKLTSDSQFKEMKTFVRQGLIVRIFGKVGGTGWDDILCIRESGRITVTEKRESERWAKEGILGCTGTGAGLSLAVNYPLSLSSYLWPGDHTWCMLFGAGKAENLSHFFFACSPNLPWNTSNCIVHRHTCILISYFHLFKIRKSFVFANSLLGLFPFTLWTFTDYLHLPSTHGKTSV